MSGRIRSYLANRIEPATDPAAVRTHMGLRWWRELLYGGAFYIVYSAIRNQFGSAAVSPSHALDHALQVVDIERGLHLFFEETVQGWFITATPGGAVDYQFTGARYFLEFWNVFYGTFHFVVTAVAMVWLFRKFPADYPKWRNTLAATTALALVGFSLYPLMPPRLLTDTGVYGAGLVDQFTFVDTLSKVGGLWSFDSGTMQKVSNQYAAMPSLHFAWSTWSALVLFPRLRRPWARVLALLYPWVTLWAIVVTANHFWLDAVGGAVILAFGYLAGSRMATAMTIRRETRIAISHHHPETSEIDLDGGDRSPRRPPPGSMVGTGSSGYGAEDTALTSADGAVRASTDPDRRPPAPHVSRDDQQPG